MKLPRSLTMSASSEFAKVREKGIAKPGRYLVLSTLEDVTVSKLKVGFITTKKVGKAHTRNLLRRRFRAILQKHGDFIDSGRYVVTIARWRAAEATYRQLESDWVRTARKLGVLKSEK